MKPTLLIMAAGMGSRYGTLKQMACVDSAGHRLMDYSLYDARLAGFERAVFIISRAMESDFLTAVVDPLRTKMEVDYLFQELHDLPAGFTVPEQRTKPWGTAHAVYCARHKIAGSFAVINADDYYGREAFQKIYDFLLQEKNPSHHTMVGYQLQNTLSAHGQVSRGICTTDDNHHLLEIHERTQIEPAPGGAIYQSDEKETVFLPNDTIVSMNLWGFQHSILQEISERFPPFLEDTLQHNPLRGEYYLPSVPDQLIREGRASVSVLSSPGRWYGITFAQDMDEVQQAVKKMQQQGKYPEHF